MPTEIENYVHRIGRTGRCGKTGVATTFINKTVEETSLLDLKALLIEAKQRVPPVLQAIQVMHFSCLFFAVAICYSICFCTLTLTLNHILTSSS
jgi:hypothetical protein